MPDVMSILSSLKGKVLDATHFEILHHAYELQQQNLQQLKENNTALKESNALLREKIERVEAEAHERFSQQGLVDLAFRDGLYYAGDQDVPYCPRCWDAERIQIRLHRSTPFERKHGKWTCKQCDNQFGGPG